MAAKQGGLTESLRRDAKLARQTRENARLRRIAQTRRLVRLCRVLAENADDGVLWGTIERATRFGEGRTGPIGKATFSPRGLPVSVQNETVGLSEPRSDVPKREGFAGEAVVRYAAFTFRDGRRPMVYLDVLNLSVSGDRRAAADLLIGMKDPNPGMARRWLRSLLDDLENWLDEYEKNPGVRGWGTPAPAAKLGDGLHLNTDGSIDIKGPMTTERMLPMLLDHLGRFLAHLDTLGRDDAGRYVVGESDDTRTRGSWESWQIVQRLADMTGQTMHDIRSDHEMGFLEPFPGTRPIVETLSALPFVMAKPRGEHWPATIPAEAVEKIKTIRDELALWRDHFGFIEPKPTAEAVVPEPEQAEAAGGGDDTPALTPGHYECLRVMQIRPLDAWQVNKVAGKREDTTNRESTGVALRDLAHPGHGLVQRLGHKKGYQLTEKGRMYSIPKDRLPGS